MFRNQYDTDITTWSPQGRLFQVEYAMEAVRQGGCTIGITSKTHAVLATLNRAQSELASATRKMFKIDHHVGIAISGVAADGRILCRFMRNECMNHRFTFESALPVGRLVREVADRSQEHTQHIGLRPYGVGLLVVGADAAGPHLYQTCPSGLFWKYKANAIGARSQAARTYLERKMDDLADASVDEVIRHALLALQASQQDGELTTENVEVAVVSVDQDFTMLTGEKLAPFLAMLETDQPVAEAEAEAAAAAEQDGPAPMEEA